MSAAENQVAMPASLHLAKIKPNCVPMFTRKAISYPSTQTSFTSNGEAEIVIQTGGAGCFYNAAVSYLEFDLTLRTEQEGRTTYCWFGDAGVAGVIRKQEIYVMGALIENVDNANVIRGHINRKHGVTTGSSGNVTRALECIPSQTQHCNFTTYKFDSAPSANSNNTPESLPMADIAGYAPYAFDGDNWYSYSNDKTTMFPNGQWANNAGVTMRYQIELFSGLLGTMANKQWPALLVGNNSMKIKLTFADRLECISNIGDHTSGNVCTTGSGNSIATGAAMSSFSPSSVHYEITNLRWVGMQTLLPDATANEVILRAAAGRDIALYSNTYMNYRTTLPTADALVHNITLNQSISSANSFTIMFRDSNVINRMQEVCGHPYLPTSLAMAPNGSNGPTVQLRIGAEYIPPFPISSAGEILLDSERSLHTWGDYRHESGMVNSLLITPAGTFTDFSNNMIVGSHHYTATGSGGAGDRKRYNFTGSTFAIEFDLDTIFGASDYLRSGRLIGANTVQLNITSAAIRRQYDPEWKSAATSTSSSDMQVQEKKVLRLPRMSDYTTSSAARSCVVDCFTLHDIRISMQSRGVVMSNN